MSKPVKFFVAAVGAFVLLLAAFAIYLFTVFDPNDYKEEIRQLVKDQTQLDLNISGDLSLSVFPWLGVSVGQMSIDTPDGPLGSLDQARIYAKTAPLFSGKLEVQGVALKNLQLNLQVNEQGMPNWQIAPADSATPEPAAPQSLPLAAFSVDELNIENASIIYQDLQQGSYHQISEFEFSSRKVRLDKGSFPLRGELLYRRAPQGVAIPVSFRTQVTPRMDPLGAALDDLRIELGSAQLEGTLNATRLLEAIPSLDAQLHITGLNPGDWSELLASPGLAAIQLPMTLALTLALDGSREILTVNTLQLTADHLAMSATIEASQLSEEPNYTARLNIDSSSVRQLVARLGVTDIQTSDPDALGLLALRAQLKGDTANLRVSELGLQLDDMQAGGTLEVKNFEAPEVKFNLQSGVMNLDRYFPPAAEEAEEPSAADAALLPVAAMREINGGGTIRIQQLVASGLSLENLQLTIDARDGLININPLQAGLYEGQLIGSTRIDARDDTPVIQITQTLTGMQAAPVLKTLADIDAIAGRLNLQLDATTSGNSRAAATENLNGSVELSVEEGQISGVDLERMVCSAIAKIRQQPLASPASDNPLTRFEQLNAKMLIRNGVVNTEALNLAISKIRTRGTGSINLVDNSLDFGLKALVVGDLEDEACRVSERYRDIEWPVRCKGSLEGEISDLCGLDWDGVQKIAGKLAEAELKSKAKEKISEKLGGEAGKLLEGLFGR